MSEKMQEYRRKGKKFVEGRLKLSTSCTECHRRKQKCDRAQPCRHCSRRYPQPPCIYRKIKDNSISDDPIAGKDLALNGHVENSNPAKGKEIDQGIMNISYPRLSSHDNTNEEVRSEVGSSSTTSVSIKKYEEFNSHSNQNLLSNMVAVLCEDVIGDFQASENKKNHGVQGQMKASDNLDKLYINKKTTQIQMPKSKRDDRFEQRMQKPSRFSITSVDSLHFLGITPTEQNGELLHAFVTIIVKYPVSVDGKPTPNYYNDHWVPWCMKLPILAYMGIFTSACYQAEIMKTPPSKSAIVLKYKIKIINMLNEMLNTQSTAISVEAVVVVIYMMTNEWYWSDYDSTQAHMKGLKQMVKLRGGIDKFGMGGFVKMMILLNDYYLACSYNEKPHFAHTLMLSPPHIPNLSTPFVPSSCTFVSLASTLNISPMTASVLDDMRFLLLTLQAHISNPSPSSLSDFRTTGLRIFSRLKTHLDSSSTTNLLQPDHAKIHISVLIASLIFCRALTIRSPLDSNCSFTDLQMLWGNMWQITLTRWKTMPGIFLFIILAAIPAAQVSPHGRFLKSMLKTTTAYIGLENWEVVDATLGTYVMLQEWLRGVDEIGNRGSGKGDGKVKQLEFVHFYGR